MEEITFDDFLKVDLRVAKIIEAQRIEGSDKLLKIKIDLGEEQRQVIAGIGKHYDLEELINKSVVVVINLEKKEILGEDSQGMILAVKDEDGLSLIVPEKEIKIGSKIS